MQGHKNMRAQRCKGTRCRGVGVQGDKGDSKLGFWVHTTCKHKTFDYNQGVISSFPMSRASRDYFFQLYNAVNVNYSKNEVASNVSFFASKC